RAELGRQHRAHFVPPAGPLFAAPLFGAPPFAGALSSGVQPCCLAMRSPARVGGPAVVPSVACPSLNPARILLACRQVHSVGAPRVGLTSAPVRSPSTS